MLLQRYCKDNVKANAKTMQKRCKTHGSFAQHCPLCLNITKSMKWKTETKNRRATNITADTCLINHENITNKWHMINYQLHIINHPVTHLVLIKARVLFQTTVWSWSDLSFSHPPVALTYTHYTTNTTHIFTSVYCTRFCFASPTTFFLFFIFTLFLIPFHILVDS